MTALDLGSVYRSLGVRGVINASATLTRLGGSLMPAPVVQAMADAAGSFVDLEELHRKVGERLATLTGNEAAYVSSGATAGIVLTVTACLVGLVPERRVLLPDTSTLPRNEVIIQRGQRNVYDLAVRQTGARVVEIEPTADALESALSERTAAVLHFAGVLAAGTLGLDAVVMAAHRWDVPVIVDAAAQIPPISTLWRFTGECGADAVILSGGKGLRGPQASGLILGRRDLVEGCRFNGSPNHGIGRPMKVGKEELMGLLAAVEWALDQDEPGIIAGYEASVTRWVDGLAGISGVRAERAFPSEAGQPHGRAVVHLGPGAKLGRDELVAALWDHDPRIAVGTAGDDAIALNPQTLQPGEDELVLQAVLDVLRPDRGVLDHGSH
jgi:L-seryl-tRNA(Ser) seleniumtransferase